MNRKFSAIHKVLKMLLIFACALLLLPAAEAQSAERQTLRDHVPAAVGQLQAVGRLEASKILHLAIGLQLRNAAEFTKLLDQIYTPTSTNFHRYLSPELFAARFGPTDQDYQAALNFAKTNVLTVTQTYVHHVSFYVLGKVSDIERAFRISLRIYRHPQENWEFFAPDDEPSVEAGLAIIVISGLNNYNLPRAGLDLGNLRLPPQIHFS